MIIMKYAVRPIIQIEGIIGTKQKVAERKKDLPRTYDKKGEPNPAPKPRGRITQMRAQFLTH